LFYRDSVALIHFLRRTWLICDAPSELKPGNGFGPSAPGAHGCRRARRHPRCRSRSVATSGATPRAQPTPPTT